MVQGRQGFENELREIGYEPEQRQDGRTVFPYIVKSGRFKGQLVQLGFEVPGDFPMTPPHGPHFTPRLQPFNPGAGAHPDRVHESPFGADWQHWSRPPHGWRGKESVATYMSFIDRLFETV